MAKRISPEEWVPKDIDLSPRALDAVKSEKTSVVVAGPGAGKTELLAQRACYLLQTGLCPPPQRILAISFKRDAAENLAQRVEKRCGRELASRLDSWTFDAFAKGLVDRFGATITDDYRPLPDYELLVDSGELDNRIRSLRPPANYRGIRIDRERLTEIVDAYCPELPFPDGYVRDPNTWVIRELWTQFLTGQPQTFTFPMLGRLAQLLLKQNPSIVRALRATYSHVFLDEFQDTTTIQYDLIRTAFRDSQTVLTAVGDHKQRIMGWAGALPDSFSWFERDFTAGRVELLDNYRSAPRLVEIQQVVAYQLDPLAATVVAKNEQVLVDQACKVLLFRDYEQEARVLARAIRMWMTRKSLAPRNICILTKQEPEINTVLMRRELAKLGMKARVEQTLQDLLTEPATQLILDVFSLAVQSPSPEAWQRLLRTMYLVRRFHEDTNPRQLVLLETQIQELVKEVKEKLSSITPQVGTKRDVQDVINDIFRFVGVRAFRALFPRYQSGGTLNYIVMQTITFLWTSRQTNSDWSEAITDFLGTNSIPIMTVHKSKGLEFEVVVFLGLDDQSFWSFANQQVEDTSTFFVALSRARRRMYITYAEQRFSRRSDTVVGQSRKIVEPLYSLLRSAGVPEVDRR